MMSFETVTKYTVYKAASIQLGYKNVLNNSWWRTTLSNDLAIREVAVTKIAFGNFLANSMASLGNKEKKNKTKAI